MQFFERQDAVRRRSRRLVAMFVVAVVGIIVVLNAVAWLVLVAVPGRPDATWPVLIATTFAALMLMGGASLYRSLSLRRGGAAVAQAMGATPVPADTQDPRLRRLRNVVEEMAIAAGVPLPEVFVLEDEVRINAFAAGFTPADAAIAVTRGALDRLNRSELQGVIAHEFGHILNGDIRLNLRLVGWLFGIVVLGLVGRQLLRGASGGRREGMAVAAIGLVLLAIGAVGLFAARLIKAGISRQREFLADASALQFTRETDGLVGAFLKIAGVPGAGRMVAAEAEEISHMLFDDAVGLSGWMATHPPLIERIRALRPGFKPQVLEDALARQHLAAPDGLAEDERLGFAAPPPLPAAGAEQILPPPAAGLALGQWQPEDHERAIAVLGALPDVLARSARDREEAAPLLFGLLLAREAGVRRRQRVELEARVGARLAQQADDYAERLADLHAALRLPLAQIAMASLRRRPVQELEGIADTCFALAHADGRISLFEYGLGQLLHGALADIAHPRRHWRRPEAKPPQLEAEIVALLAVMAEAGHDQPADAQRAFMAGLQRILPDSAARYSPPKGGHAALDEAWPKLDALLPKGKLQLVEALAAAAAHDQRLGIAEAELLRIVCAVLHAPLPAALAAPRA